MRFIDTAEDPHADLWADPAFVDAYYAAVEEQFDPEVFEEEPLPPEVLPEFDPVPELTGLLCSARVLSAQTDAAFAYAIRAAEHDPERWVGPDPTDDPGWEDPRGRSHAQVRAHRRTLAVRAAAADLAIRVRLSENTVRARAHRADTLRERCPRVWDAYLAGEISEQNAATTATLASSLPTDRDAWATFDEALAEVAARLTPGKFRTRARVTWERVHPESLADRHARAMQDRDVRFTPEHDGLTTVNALIDAVAAKRIQERLDDHAAHLRALPDETRTLAQLRADVLTSFLTADANTGIGGGDETRRGHRGSSRP